MVAMSTHSYDWLKFICSINALSLIARTFWVYDSM